MPTVQQIRFDNLRMLVSLYGGERNLADLTDLTEAYLVSILKGNKSSRGKPRNLGNEAARKIEEGLGKPEGWMDVPRTAEQIDPPNENLTPEDRTLLTLYHRANPELRAAIMQVAKLAK